MNILYEDNHIIVAVKPQNVPSQADSSGDADMLSLVKEYVRVKYNKPGEAYIGLVHRLDRPAGGLMAFARTSKAAARLSRQIRDGGFQKQYLAIVSGDIPPTGTLRDYLYKDTGSNTSSVVSASKPSAKYAELTYRTLQQREKLSLLSVDLKTGRHHQIRVQLSHIGAPLYGDYRYGGIHDGGLCLWAHKLSFIHPTLKTELSFTAEPPDAYPWTLFQP